MIVIENTILSDDLIEESFVCDLNRCKGACCKEGDLGAPLEESEKQDLSAAWQSVEPYLTPRGLSEIKKQGLFVRDFEGDFSTPLIGKGGPCAYAVPDAENTLKCAIELAWKEGKTTFKKPISCHLYPIRIGKVHNYYTLNYDRWDICRAACSLGKKLGVPVYRFLREALIRRFGAEWYEMLEKQVVEAEKNDNKNQTFGQNKTKDN